MVFFREILQEPCVVTNHYGTKDFHLNEEATSGNLLAVYSLGSFRLFYYYKESSCWYLRSISTEWYLYSLKSRWIHQKFF